METLIAPPPPMSDLNTVTSSYPEVADASLLGKVASADDIQRALQQHTAGQDATRTRSHALA